MLVIIQGIILYTLFIIPINCDLKFVDPIYQQFSKYDYNRSKMFSTMSPYIIDEVCVPIRLWLTTRHGAKYPSEDIVENITTKLVPNIQGTLQQLYCPNDCGMNFSKLKKDQKKIITGIMEWENVLANATHKDLINDGKLAMTSLGKRLNTKLKKLTETLLKEEIEVISAKEDRCVISGKKILRAFYEGDHDDIIIKIIDPSDKRLELRKPSKDSVMIYDTNTRENVYAEDYFFRKHCPKITERIQELLFPNNIPGYENSRKLVTNDMVKYMYYACAHSYKYFNTNGNRADAWCWLFKFEDLQMFEEMHDVQYWYKNGYNQESNRDLGNAITEDMLNFIKDPKGLKFKLFIGHTSNFLSIITRFNLFRDNDLNVHNIRSMPNRKWKTSLIAPFGCNIMAVVYDCGYETFRVSIFINEVPLEMVLDNGQTCIKCPMGAIEKLIRTYYNVEDVPQPEPKINKKKDKRSEWSLDKIKQKEADIAEKLIERLKYHVYDDEVDFSNYKAQSTSTNIK